MNIEQNDSKTDGDSSLPRSIGMGASGKKDLSSRTEELLWQDD